MKEILEIFGISGKREKLPGGQGQSLRVGDFVIKPIEEKNKYSWIGEVFMSVSSQNLAIAKPIRSKNGNFVENGYGVTHYIEGDFFISRIAEKVKACIELNQLLQTVAQPADWKHWSSPWQLANRVAWEEADLPGNTDIQSREIIESIKANYKPVYLTRQLIHSDLAGNILFNGSTPVIIDFSPEFRPEAFAEILLITDSIAWHQEPINSLWTTKHVDSLVSQLALRAIVFRLSVMIFLKPKNHAFLLKEFKNFQPLLNVLK
ncbi:hypothetical protein [Emticicia agri]|uniref:Aminoglycoside phosphotransferase domain-containing protein n=1 Tax=Emticicia agri TaxID=2492393 RepID=A0A4Q5M434_9BACT|nr:hypothetical protein [Emticicia agri]RYU97196.1 hypothetical protein EWM59_02570 [Emticicia agri]